MQIPWQWGVVGVTPNWHCQLVFNFSFTLNLLLIDSLQELVPVKDEKYEVSLELDLEVWGQIIVFVEHCLVLIYCWTPQIDHTYLSTF